ncbi:inositol monophosphatase family protein [Streptomyces sp. MA15]|uniref:inositol monophosphatase family protein n=1 Tax=Streptomyces sp. MA15 TaxID=3055061 RepID=UPI0025B2417B|nr:inositol monophosphatase family protein [Streptomyces sp. MA15]MDN3270120.1 inositol monophosphatase family protein [Streptomyces sp. MA15]
MIVAFDTDRLTATAAQAAAEAGKELLRWRGTRLTVRSKEGDAPVSDADLAAEHQALGILRMYTPDFGIVSEESGAVGLRDGRPTWIVDPLDGTTNYLRGLPDYAVALALIVEGRTHLSLIRFPESGEVFRAVAGQGAFRNDAPLHIGDRPPGRPLVATGFGTDGVVRGRQRSVADRLLNAGFEIREPGSASTGLCRVASGAYDGYLEFGIGVWDTVPGALLVVEAGGTVTGWGGAPFTSRHDNVVAASPAIHRELVEAGGPCPPVIPEGQA